MKKRILACFLCLLMLVSMIPISVSATEFQVRPDQITAGVYTCNADGQYKFSGEFTDEVEIKVEPNMDVTLDGSQATFKSHTKITIDQVADGVSYLNKPRMGNVTIQNMTVEDSLAVGANSTSITVKNSMLKALDFNASNCMITVDGNMIVNDSAYERYNSTHQTKSALYVYADNYELVLSNNDLTSTSGDVISIQGEYESVQKNISRNPDGSWPYTNRIEISENNLDSQFQSAVFHIWNDMTYAPVEWPTMHTITAPMIELAKEIKTENKINGVGETNSIIEVLCRAAEQSDRLATEKNHDALKNAIAIPATVNIVIYRNGDTTTPFKTVDVPGYNKGDEINIADLDINTYYTSANGYEFEGWYNDGGWNNYKAGNPNNKLTAINAGSWTNIICMVTDYENIVVKSVTNGDKDNAETIETFTAPHGTKLIDELNTITIDEKPGYTLDKWYNWDWYGNKIADNATVNGWTNVYVTYTPNEYTITYDFAFNNSYNNPPQTVSFDSNVKLRTAPKRNGYTFIGWTYDGNTYSASDTIRYDFVKDITLTAEWIANSAGYLFVPNGGVGEKFVLPRVSGEAFVYPVNPFTREGYKFIGWSSTKDAKHPNTGADLRIFKENEKIGNQTVINESNIIRYAIWSPLTYTITYKVDGEIVTTYEFKCDAEITGINVTAPTKVGSEFAGWDKKLPATMPAENIVINAVWNTSSYTMKFMDDTTILAEAVYTYGAAVAAPAAPTKEGFTFAGWVDAEGNAVEIPATMPASNLTLYASWTEDEKPVQQPTFDYVLFALAARYSQKFDVVVSADNATVTGDLSIKYKRNGTVDIAVADGYKLVDVIANGQSLGAVDSVTFKRVVAPQTLVVVTEALYTNPYADIADDNAAVQYVTENGIMTAVEEGKFAPEAEATRALIADVLYTLAGKPEFEATVTVNDSTDAAILWAASNGILTPDADGLVKADTVITMADLNAALNAYAGTTDVDYIGLDAEAAAVAATRADVANTIYLFCTIHAEG